MMAGSMRCVGLSMDGRTNKWHINMPCGHAKSPPTSMFSKQVLQCDVCLEEANVDYNAGTIIAARGGK